MLCAEAAGKAAVDVEVVEWVGGWPLAGAWSAAEVSSGCAASQVGGGSGPGTQM